MNAVESLVMTQLTAMNSVKQPSLESKHRKITLACGGIRSAPFRCRVGYGFESRPNITSW